MLTNSSSCKKKLPESNKYSNLLTDVLLISKSAWNTVQTQNLLVQMIAKSIRTSMTLEHTFRHKTMVKVITPKKFLIHFTRQLRINRVSMLTHLSTRLVIKKKSKNSS